MHQFPFNEHQFLHLNFSKPIILICFHIIIYMTLSFLHLILKLFILKYNRFETLQTQSRKQKDTLQGERKCKAHVCEDFPAIYAFPRYLCNSEKCITNKHVYTLRWVPPLKHNTTKPNYPATKLNLFLQYTQNFNKINF